MFRVIVVLLLAICIAGGVAYGTGLLKPLLPDDPIQVQVADGTSHRDMDIGEPLYEIKELPPLKDAPPLAYKVLPFDLCSVIAYTQDVSSPKGVEGHLLFVGTPVDDKDAAKLTADGRQIHEKMYFDGKDYVKMKYRPLEEIDTVHENQIVAVINPVYAQLDMDIKSLKVTVANVKCIATKAILRETEKRLATLKRLKATGPVGVVSDTDIGDAEVSVAKYNGEWMEEQESINIAKQEWQQAVWLRDCHFLRSDIKGISRVHKIYKKEGEAVKAQDSTAIMQLWTVSKLKIEGSIDSQYANTLLANKKATCYLEPSVKMEPRLELMQAHTGEVTCVAVLADNKRFVSGSDDHTVCVWQEGRSTPLRTLDGHHSPVRTVAARPQGAWIVVGCDDGKIMRWDLDDETQKKPFEFKNPHRGRVTALAFSPDGEYLATGGEDNSIVLRKVADGEVVYTFDESHGVHTGHQGTVTSLHFTPQCTLVSAARDNTLRIWKLGKKGVETVKTKANRDGTVGQLDVSRDGRFLLFDKSRTLHLLNAADQSTVCTLDNLVGSNAFDTLALFSPDSSLMLTGGAGEGRLHLWKTPTADERAYQVRELVTNDRAMITAAAFAPGEGAHFAVTGSKLGYVHLWRLPDKAAVDNHRIMLDGNNQPFHLVVEPANDGTKTRALINVHTPLDANGDPLLKPGQRVTLVVKLAEGK